jgi:hypothetical protein
VEFCRKEWLEEVKGGRIRGDRILAEASQDFPHSPASLAAYQQGFGWLRRLPAADRGVYSAANEATAQQGRGTRIVIPCGRKSSPERVGADYVLEGNYGERCLWRGGFPKIFPEV